MRPQAEVYAERAKVEAEIASIQVKRKPLLEAFVKRRTEPYTEEQDKELVELTAALTLRNTQLKVLDWVCGAGSWSVLNWQTPG